MAFRDARWRRRAIALCSLIALLASGLAVLRMRQLEASGKARLQLALSQALGMRARVASVELSWLDLSLVARGVRLDDAQGRPQLTASVLRLHSSLTSLAYGGIDLAAMQISGAELTLRKTTSVPPASRKLEGFAIRGARVVFEESPQTRFELAKADVTLHPASGELRVKAEGSVATLVYGGARVALRGVDVELALAAQRLHGQGRVALDTPSVGGHVLAKQAKIAWRAQDGVFRLTGELATPGKPGLEFSASVALDSAGLSFEALRLQQGASALHGNARVERDQTLVASLSGADVELADLPQVAIAPLAGRGRLSLRAEGPLRAPDLRIELAVEHAAIGDMPLGSASATLVISDALRAYRFERIASTTKTRALSGENLRLRIDGGHVVDAQGSLRAERLPLAELYALLGVVPAAALTRLQGDARGSAQWKYLRTQSRGELELQLALDVREPSVDGYRFDSGRLLATLSAADVARVGLGVVVEQLSLVADAGKLVAKGTIDQGGGLDLQATAEALPLARFAWLQKRAPGLVGHVDGALTLRGTRDAPAFDAQLVVKDVQLAGRVLGHARMHVSLAGSEPSGTIAVDELALQHGRFALANVAPIVARVERGQVTLADAELRGKEVLLRVGADGSFARGVRIFADGTAPASLLSGLHKRVTGFGTIGVHAELAPDAQPWLQGHLDLRDLVIQVDEWTFLRNFTGKIALQGERLRFQDLEVALGQGKLGLGGEMSLHGSEIARYDLSLRARNLALPVQPRFDVTFDANAKLHWAGAQALPELSGNLMLHRLTYGRHIPLPEALVALNREERASRAGKDRMKIDLVVQHDAPLVVRNNLVDLELSATGSDRRLRIVGSDRRLGLLGTLAVQRGRVLYRGDEFQVQSGEVTFDDEKRINPRFALRAVATRRTRPDVDVAVVVRGDRDAFDLKVTCDAAGVGTATPPFTCAYKGEALQCDSLAALLALWSCPGPQRAAAGTTHRYEHDL